MDAGVLRQNLDACLLGAAENWYTNELAHLSRIGLRNDNDGVKEWCNALESRFRDSPSKSLTALENIRYTVKDTRSRRDPLDYVSTLVLHAKNAGIAANEAVQVRLAYKHMDGELRLHLPRPQDNSTISGLLEELRHQKDIWFDIYGSHDSRQMTARHDARNDKSKQQSGNNPFRPNFNSQRPYGNFYGGNGFGGSGGAPRPYFGNSNPYRPFIPFGQNSSNNQQQPQSSQATQVQQRQLPGGRQQLQITSGRENANTSTGNNQNRQQNVGNNNRNPFRPFSSNQQNQRRPFARAYQNVAEDQENQYLDGQDEQAEYDQYEDAYYQDTKWPGSQDERNEDPKEDKQEDPDPSDTVESNFVSAVPASKFTCRRCQQTFTSNNLLHRHLRSGHTNETSLVVEPATSTKTPATRTANSDVAPSKPLTPQVICSTSTDQPVEGYAFRGFHYVTAMVQLFFLGLLFDLCFDTGCTMSLIDRKFLRENHPDAEIKKMPTPMTVKGIGSKRHEASEYVRIKMYLPSKNGSVALLERELHVVDNLTAKALIGIDIMKPKGIIVDLQNDVMKIGSCQDLEVPIVVASKGSRTNATIYSSKRMIIPPHSNVAVPIRGPSKQLLDLPQDRDFIFEPQTLDSLSAYAHIVDHTMSKVFVRNDSDRPITLPRKQKLGKVTDYDGADCYSVAPENHDLAAKAPKRHPGWIHRNLRRLVAGAAAFSAAMAPLQANSATEVVHPTGVTIHGSPQARVSIAQTVDSFPNLWKDTGNVVNVPELQHMEIPLVDNWESLYKPGQARVYPVGQRDKQVIDAEFDKLHAQDRMEWTTTATPFSFPCFVVWKNVPGGERKGRVVVDIRALNKITMPDAYPVPSQAEVLAEIKNAKIISTVDAASFFYQ